MVWKDGFNAHVPPSDFGRMQMETLRPKTIIQGLEAKIAQGPPIGLIGEAAGEYTLPLYSGESEIWD